MAKRLWYLVLVAAVLQVAVPALRERIGFWLSPPWPHRLLDPELRPGTRLWRARSEPRDPLALLATAERASGESLEGDQQAFDRALAQAPGNELLVIRRAVHLQAWYRSDTHEQTLPARRQAALAATRQASDNAVGWYLLAAAEAEAGERQAARAHVVRGNHALRLDDGSRQAVAAVQRHLECAGYRRLNALSVATNVSTMPPLARVRELVRDLAGPGSTPTERCQLAAMSARWRDESPQIVPTLAGFAVCAIAYRDPAVLGPRNTKSSDAAYLARLARDAQRLEDQLSAEGHRELALWLHDSAARTVAGRTRSLRREASAAAKAGQRHLSAYILATTATLALGLAALLTLSLAHCCPRGARPAPRGAWLAVPVGLAVMALLLWSISRGYFAYAEESNRARYALLCAMLLTGVAPAAVVGLWAPPRRCGEATRALLITMAAILLLCSWGVQAPAIRHETKTIAWLESIATGSDADLLRQSMDAAAPARLLPTEARP
ncbi:MAG: hypothetical protein HY856_11740 [Burkholderiales bacterium]|nr:hypothetical protein [Burkholderiales bacterium]MBI5830700.1 hypothetical protein [Armatimonadota bacterium]